MWSDWNTTFCDFLKFVAWFLLLYAPIKLCLYTQLISLLREKLQGGSYFALRHGFTSFDPQGRGTVSREALYRLLSNFLSNTLTPAQFSDLMKRFIR